MERYGFFGGSFNPPTKAHIQLAEEVVKEFQLDKLFFMPVGNTYKKEGLVDEKYRYEMLNLLFQNNDKIEVSDLELKRNDCLKAIDVFEMIQKQYQEKEIFYIMGADNVAKTPNWKAANDLLENHKFIVLKRDEMDLDKLLKNSKILSRYKNNFYESKNQIMIPYSSTRAREAIYEENQKEIETILPEKIYQYIKERKLYQK